MKGRGAPVSGHNRRSRWPRDEEKYVARIEREAAEVLRETRRRLDESAWEEHERRPMSIEEEDNAVNEALYDTLLGYAYWRERTGEGRCGKGADPLEHCGDEPRAHI